MGCSQSDLVLNLDIINKRFAKDLQISLVDDIYYLVFLVEESGGKNYAVKWSPTAPASKRYVYPLYHIMNMVLLEYAKCKEIILETPDGAVQVIINREFMRVIYLLNKFIND